MELKLPELGEGVHEGEVVKWLVKEGDVIKVDQPIIELMTDKATVEVPSPYAGKVEKTYGKEGDVIKVGQHLITLSSEQGVVGSSDGLSTAAQVPKSALMTAVPGPSDQTAEYMASPGNVLAAPSTRRLARELGIDLAQIRGSGPYGRVTQGDLSHKRCDGDGATAADSRTTLIPFRGIRKKISEAMSKSRFTIPDFTYVDECDISELVQFRTKAKVEAQKNGVKLTYMPFIMKAVIEGLKTFPTMNAELDESGGNVILKNYYNIGVAVDTDNGLIVPVVKNADKKSIIEIAQEIFLLSEKARAGKLARDELKDSSFTITNSGNIGGMLATPVINYPEVGILGVHKISRRPVVKMVDGQEKIVIADVIWLSVAVDHRVVDGAVAARFMNVVMSGLQSAYWG